MVAKFLVILVLVGKEPTSILSKPYNVIYIYRRFIVEFYFKSIGRGLGLCLFILGFWVGIATASLIDNGDGTVSDPETGLMWQQAEPGTMNWQNAISYCEELILPDGGYDDWRLPDLNELKSLYAQFNKTLFPESWLGKYWSSAAYALNSKLAWQVNFFVGWVRFDYKTSSNYVRAVRTGQVRSLEPLIIAFTATPLSGQVPLEVTFSCSASDPDGGNITQYRWDFDGDGVVDQTTDTNSICHTFSVVGSYSSACTVVDDEGYTTMSSAINITATYDEGEYNYYIPHYSSVDNNWTGLGLVNRNQENSTRLQITIYDNSGNSLATENKIIPPHGQDSFPVATTLNNNGWMCVNSQQPLSGLAFIGLGGNVPLMADIPFAEELATSLVIPHIAQDDIWDTSILICNPVNKANNITLQLIGQDGDLQGEEHIETVAMGSGEYDLSSLFGQGLQKSGKVKIDASSGVAAFALYKNIKSGGSYCAGINAVDESDNIDENYNYYLPGFISGDGNWSGLGLANNNENKPVSLKVVVYEEDGSELAVIDKNLPSGGQASFPVGTEITGVRGWMTINSNQSLSGLAFLGLEGNPSLMADIPFVSKLEKFLIIPHIAEDKTWETAILICNPQDQAITVTLKHINIQGVVTRQQDLELSSKGCGSYPLADILGEPMTGTVYLEASQEIAAFALYSNGKSGGSYYAGINAVAMVGEYDIIDNDGDGYAAIIDCNDNEATIHPGATVIYGDGIDQNCSGADEVVSFAKTFGGTNDEFGAFVQQTADGGYIIIGETESSGAGKEDVYLLKIDSFGNETWGKTFGGTDDDYGQSGQQTADGGYIITGSIKSSGVGSSDVYLLKTDSSGNKTWAKTFGGPNWDSATSVRQTSDGGYIVAGFTHSFGAGNADVYLLKTDSSGNKVWAKTFGGADWDCAISVKQATDGGYIIVGWTHSYGSLGQLNLLRSNNVYLIKTDSIGNELWSKAFGGRGTDIGRSVQQTADGGYIVTGSTDSFGAGKEDVYLLKIDSDGNEIWGKSFGGTDGDYGYSVLQTADGGYIITGATKSSGVGSSDVYLLKTDSSGNKTWDKTFGGIDLDSASSVQQTVDGGYIVAGFTDSSGAGGDDIYLIKTDGNGNLNDE